MQLLSQQSGSGLSAGQLRLPFAGIWLFTLLLHIRPNDFLPIGEFPLVKILTVATILVYVAAKLARGERLMIWPVELRAITAIWLLGAAHIPFAASPQDSIGVLTDQYLKVVCVFALLVNLLDTWCRLRSILKLVALSGTWMALSTIHTYLGGEYTVGNSRIWGFGSGLAGNPNDLALCLAAFLPLAVALALTSRGAARLAYFACAAALGAGVIVTFSRGGFLGLMGMAGVLIWKLGRGRRAVVVTRALAIFMAFLLAMPSGYGNRLTSIIHIDKDSTGSSEERRELIERAVVLALHHPVLGVGIGNFHIYSIHEKVAHNAYIEIAAELGLAGLLAYLFLILSSWRSLRRIEQANARAAQGGGYEAYCVSACLQAALMAYLICSVFASVQYQWPLYYLVAYSVSLRRIGAAAEGGSVTQDVDRGVLWCTRQLQREGVAIGYGS